MSSLYTGQVLNIELQSVNHFETSFLTVLQWFKFLSCVLLVLTLILFNCNIVICILIPSYGYKRTSRWLVWMEHY